MRWLCLIKLWFPSVLGFFEQLRTLLWHFLFGIRNWEGIYINRKKHLAALSFVLWNSNVEIFIYIFIYRHFFPFCPNCDLNLEPSITPSHPFGSNIEIFMMEKEIQSAGFWLMLWTVCLKNLAIIRQWLQMVCNESC